jgi:phosphotriesterase-related protein
MQKPNGKVQTVLGPVEPSELGFTLSHEHLLVNLIPPGLRDIWKGEPIRMEDLGNLRHNWHTNPVNLYLDSEDDALFELARYREADGSAVFEASVNGIERNPKGLARISKVSGVHIVMGSGYYTVGYHPPELAHCSADDICARIVDEFRHGVEGTGIKPGVIGEIGLDWPVWDGEATVLRAAAMAQRETGASLYIHPGRGAEAPLDAIERIRNAGGDPSRTVMCHVERTYFSLDEMLTLADTGCCLEFDLFGDESSYYPAAPIEMPSDAARIDYIIALVKRGYRDKLLISHDVCKKTQTAKYGGPGFGHILKNVIPLMKRKGLSDEDVDFLTVKNPAAVLSIG